MTEPTRSRKGRTVVAIGYTLAALGLLAAAAAVAVLALAYLNR